MVEAVKRESKKDQPAHAGQNTSHCNKGKSKRLSEKRLKQHQQWMRVMMDGQATPDNRYRQ